MVDIKYLVLPVSHREGWGILIAGLGGESCDYNNVMDNTVSNMKASIPDSGVGNVIVGNTFG